jgi:DnaJ-class molecular chaperone
MQSFHKEISELQSLLNNLKQRIDVNENTQIGTEITKSVICKNCNGKGKFIVQKCIICHGSGDAPGTGGLFECENCNGRGYTGVSDRYQSKL